VTGYVYVMTNPAMPGLVKVGWSKDPHERAKQLSRTTSVPLPFEVRGKVFGQRPLEAAVHRDMRSCSVGGEFFRAAPDEAMSRVESCAAWLADNPPAPKLTRADVGRREDCGVRGIPLLREWIGRQGRTQADAALAVGVHFSTVSRWLSGDSRPSLNQATRMQSVTGIPVTTWAVPLKETT